MPCTSPAMTCSRRSHTPDLTPREEIYVHIDLHQKGLGGASCGPRALEQYQLNPGEYEFGFAVEVL